MPGDRRCGKPLLFHDSETVSRLIVTQVFLVRIQVMELVSDGGVAAFFFSQLVLVRRR